jgi:cell fate regulator YaaT (PSP1 superfamily)
MEEFMSEEIKVNFTATVHDDSETGAVADGIIPEGGFVAPPEPEKAPAESETTTDEVVAVSADAEPTDTAKQNNSCQECQKRVPSADDGDVVAVRFRKGGKAYNFLSGKLAVKPGDNVIVETEKGVEYGKAASILPKEVACRYCRQMNKIIRVATTADEIRNDENREKEEKAFTVCQEKIAQHSLEMKLIEAQYTFDESKIMFYFTADGRIDFRDLVKDLAGVFHTRIELRQIGVRDETRMLGGYGACGRPLCCATYLNDFIPVSINLSLNPTKISGVCGRLMCCLKNEEETYEELNKSLPGIGDEVQGTDGLVGEVENVDVLRQKIKILVEVNDEKELHEYGIGEFTILRKRRRGSSRPSMKKKPAQAEAQTEEKKPENPRGRLGARASRRRPRPNTPASGNTGNTHSSPESK